MSILVAACAPADSTTGTVATSAEAGPSSSISVATSTTVAPESAHTLRGQWLLTYTLDSVSDDFSSGFDPGDDDIRVVEMAPTCAAGPCDVEMSFGVPYRGDVFPGTARWTGDRYLVVEELAGRGKCSGGDGTVIQDGLDLTTTLELSPAEFSASESGWVVANLTGTRVLEWSPNVVAAAAGCGTFTEEWSVAGTPFDPNVYVVPTSDPLPAGTIVFGDELLKLTAILPDGDERALTEVSQQFAVSPDGESVIYANRQGLWLAGLDGNGAHKFFPDERVSQFSELAWSSDGTKVAFVRDNIEAGSGSDVWYVEVPYGVPSRVTDGGAALGGVTWGPGDEVLFFDWGVNEIDASTNPPTVNLESTIYRVDSDGDGPIESIVTGFRPSMAGDGSAMTFLVPDLDGLGSPYRWSLMVSDDEGSSPRRTVLGELDPGCHGESQHAVELPCSAPISPDVKSLAFSDGGGCKGACDEFGFTDDGVWVWGLDTGEATKVAEFGIQPGWVNGTGVSE